MSRSHISRSNRRDAVGQTPPVGAGTAVVALGLSAFDGAGTAALALGRGILDGIDRWRRRRDAIRELSALDERLLRDIGLRRADIPLVVETLLNAPQQTPVAAATDGRPRIEPRGPVQVPVGCG